MSETIKKGIAKDASKEQKKLAIKFIENHIAICKEENADNDEIDYFLTLAQTIKNSL